MASTFLVHLLRPARIAAGMFPCCLVLACAEGEVNDGGDGVFGTDTTGDTAGDGDGDGDSTGDTTGEGDGDGDSGPGDGDGGPGDGDGDCTSIGCECDDSPGSCASPLACIEGTCASGSCGDGIVDAPAEDCDDANNFEGDGCNVNCSWTQVPMIAAGASHTCALIEGGRVRCWGLNHVGQLGYGNTDNIGDNEDPSLPGDVVLGEKAQSISVGSHHACAQLIDGTARCWGYNGTGQLGQGNTENVGDNEFPFSVNPININTDILGVSAGGNHTCALVGSGTVRCWGNATSGQLGYGNTTVLPVPLTVDLNLGTLVTKLSTGFDHNCALLDDGKVRCWGRNDRGQLGYGNTENIGDNEVPGSVVPVPILPQGIMNGVIADLALADTHSCVLYETGEVLCWGENFYGQLGQAMTSTVGDNETLATLYPVDLGGEAAAIALGKHHTCALLTDGGVKCWGRNLYGQLGRGDIAHIGDDEFPAEVEAIELGGAATSITAGDYHTCAIVDGHEVVCWGFNDYGQLGYGDTQTRGDNELPVDSGGIDLL